MGRDAIAAAASTRGRGEPRPRRHRFVVRAQQGCVCAVAGARRATLPDAGLLADKRRRRHPSLRPGCCPSSARGLPTWPTRSAIATCSRSSLHPSAAAPLSKSSTATGSPTSTRSSWPGAGRQGGSAGKRGWAPGVVRPDSADLKISGLHRSQDTLPFALAPSYRGRTGSGRGWCGALVRRSYGITRPWPPLTQLGQGPTLGQHILHAAVHKGKHHGGLAARGSSRGHQPAHPLPAAGQGRRRAAGSADEASNARAAGVPHA